MISINVPSPTSDNGKAAEGSGYVPLVAEGPGVVIYAGDSRGEKQTAAHQAQKRVLDSELRNI